MESTTSGEHTVSSSNQVAVTQTTSTVASRGSQLSLYPNLSSLLAGGAPTNCNAIINLPSSFSLTRTPASNSTITPSLLSVTPLPQLEQQPSVVFTDKPIVILNNNASTLLSRVLDGSMRMPVMPHVMVGGDQHQPCTRDECDTSSNRTLTVWKGPQHHSTLAELMGKNVSASLTAIESIDDSTIDSGDMCSVPDVAMAMDNHKEPTEKLDAIDIPNVQNDNVVPPQSTNLSPLGQTTFKCSVPYFTQCEEREEELVLQDSDSELEMSEPSEEITGSLHEYEVPSLKRVISTSNQEIEELCIPEGGKESGHFNVVPTTQNKSDLPKIAELPSERCELETHTTPNVHVHVSGTSDIQHVPEIEAEQEMQVGQKQQEQMETPTLYEEHQPHGEEPPFKKQRLSMSNEEKDSGSITLDPASQDSSESSPQQSQKSFSSSIFEVEKLSSQDLQHLDILIDHRDKLEYPHEPQDTASDGISTADQTLPSECARTHALFPNVVHCDSNRQGPSSDNNDDDNDRDNPSGVVVPTSDEDRQTTLLEIQQIPFQQEDNTQTITMDKSHSLQSSPNSLESTTEHQIVPGDSLDSSFTMSSMYTDMEHTKREPCKPSEETPPLTTMAVELSSLKTTTTTAKLCPDQVLPTSPPTDTPWPHTTYPTYPSCYGDRSKLTTIPITSSDMTSFTHLNLTKPYLRLGLSKRQKCRPLHHRRK